MPLPRFTPVFRFTLTMCMYVKMCLLGPFVKEFHDDEVVFLHPPEGVLVRQLICRGAGFRIETTSEEVLPECLALYSDRPLFSLRYWIIAPWRE